MVSGPQRDIQIESALGRTALSEAWYHSKWGRSFMASEEYTNASVGETATLYLENPSGSGVSAVFQLADGNPGARSYSRIYDAFDSDPTGGTSVDVENNLLDKGGEGQFYSGSVNVERGVTFTATNTYRSGITGGGVGGTSQSGHSDGAPFIIEPGRRVVIEVEKLTSDGDNVVIEASWFEVDRVYTEQNEPFDTEELY